VTSAGQQDWTFISDGQTATSPDSVTAYATDVDVDSSGNVIFTGSFNNWMKLGSTQLTSQAVFEQYSMYNGFIGRLTSTGTGATGWAFGGKVFDLSNAIKPTSDGGFVVAGMLSASASVGGKTVTAGQDGSAFVARFTSAGQATWVKALPGKGNARGVALAPDGKVHFVGSFENKEILYSYDPVADQLTSRTTVSGDADNNTLQTNHVAVTTTGAIYISGTFTGTIDLGAGSLSTSTVAAFLWRAN
jgi:hypothetical protein